MKLGLHPMIFSWPGGPAAIEPTLADVLERAEEAGIHSIWPMDHFFQIPAAGQGPDAPMLEGWATIAWAAGRTRTLQLGTLVTGVVYRSPGLLAKAATTLDVLSGGRAWLGIGAAWNEEESRGLDLFFPPTEERFERLEEALQICLQMWSDSEAPYDGQHYHLARTLNSPQSLQRPHPPILIGGSGEKKTLRMVAQYAQACNLWGGPELERKLDILRGHCEALGRDYDEIQKTVMFPLDPGKDGENVDSMLEQLQGLAALGISHAHGRVANVSEITPLEILGERVIPVAAGF